MDILELALEMSRNAKLDGTARPVRLRSEATVTLVTPNKMIPVPTSLDDADSLNAKCLEFMNDVKRIAAEARRVREQSNPATL